MNQILRASIYAGSFFALFMLTGVIIWNADLLPIEEKTATLSLPRPPLIDENELDTILPPEAIPAIDDPLFEPVAKAENIGQDERIIAVDINGDVRAYPLTILSTHEIVNDTVGGQQIAVTWCPLCYSALVFERQVNGQSLSFGVSGKLLQNTLVMIDRQTGSLWSQLYGGSINGKFAGTPLNVYPSILTDWESWAVKNPEGLVLSKKKTCAQFNCGNYANNPRGSYAVDPYASYYQSADEGVVNRQIPRDSENRQQKQRVLGVRVNGATRAYPFSVLMQQPVINDNLAGIPILIWFNPVTMTGAAYHRQIEDDLLTFQADPDNPAFLRDQETNSLWYGPKGSAESGEHQHNKLTPLVSTPAFEFGWYGYFPQSDTYQLK